MTGACVGENLISWLFMVSEDESLTSGYKLNIQLAADYWGLFWDDGENVTPTWAQASPTSGSGTSSRFAKGSLAPDPTNPDKIVLVPTATSRSRHRRRSTTRIRRSRLIFPAS